MKRFFGLLIATAILAALASPAFSQTCRQRRYYEPARTSRVYYDNSNVYYGDSRAYYDYRSRRNFWDRHRDKLTMAIGAGSGAAIGGLIGGKRGAVIGAVGGAAGSALYTYKLRNRGYRY